MICHLSQVRDRTLEMCLDLSVRLELNAALQEGEGRRCARRRCCPHRLLPGVPGWAWGGFRRRQNLEVLAY